MGLLDDLYLLAENLGKDRERPPASYLLPHVPVCYMRHFGREQ